MNERLLNEEIKPGPDTAPETTSFGEVQMVREVWPIPGGRVAASTPTKQQRSRRSWAAGLPRSTPTKSTPTHSDKMESELENSKAIIRGARTSGW